MWEVVFGKTSEYSWLASLRAMLRGKEGSGWFLSVKGGSCSLLLREEMPHQKKWKILFCTFFYFFYFFTKK